MNKIILFICALTVLVFNCVFSAQDSLKGASSKQLKLTNPAHLNHLFEKVHVNGQEVGVIHIYAQAPDYNWLGDDDEGIACVDDAARAVVFYLRFYDATGDKQSLDRARLLLKFVLEMQAENGLFYNFIWPDLSIHKDGITTKPILGWWTARAIWALGEGTRAFRKIDPQFADELHNCARRSYSHLDTLMQKYGEIKQYQGFSVPQWLLYNSAADATSELMLGLIAFLKDGQGALESGYIHKFAEAFLHMQRGNATHFPYGVFPSWKNVWHGWGNSQAYALLQLNEYKFRKAAELEVKNFYPYIANKAYIRELNFQDLGDGIKFEINMYEQIAYNIRPMVMAASTLNRKTGEGEYARAASRYASWFFGENIAKAQLYDPKTGRCFDGINRAGYININSGAESTIEALMVMIEIETNPMVLAAFQEYLPDN